MLEALAAVTGHASHGRADRAALCARCESGAQPAARSRAAGQN